MSRTRRNSTSTSVTFTVTIGRPRVSCAGSTLPWLAKPSSGSSGPVSTIFCTSEPTVLPLAAASADLIVTVYFLFASRYGKRRRLLSSSSTQEPSTFSPFGPAIAASSSNFCAPASGSVNATIAAGRPS